MTKKMLQFVDLKQETPEKRGTEIRRGDFNEIYEDYIKKKQQTNQADVLNVGFLFVKFIVH